MPLGASSPDLSIDGQPGAARAGILLILSASVFFAFLDTGAKYLSETYLILQIVWARYFFQMVLPPFMVGRRQLLHVARTNNLGLQALRSLLLLGATVAFFTAIRFIPLADATAISFVAPLLLTAFSIPLLGEKVGVRRWAAVVVGFCGALIVIRPGLVVMHWAATMPLLSAACFSLYQITTRKLAAIDSPITTFFYTGAIGAVVTTLVVPFVWRWPTLNGWVLMVCLGVLGGLGHYCLIQAFRRTLASTLAPFNFVSIVWMGVLGYVVFDDLPDIPTIVGTSVIIASGIYVFHRENVAVRIETRSDSG